MNIDNENIEKYLTIILIIVLLVVIYKHIKKRSNETYENSYLPNYKVNVNCRGNNGKMMKGDNDIEFTTESSTVSGSISTDDSSSSQVSGNATDKEDLINSGEIQKNKNRKEILGDKNRHCILDQWGDELFRFASNQVCDCNKNSGCSVCDMKHNNEHDVVEKICKRKNTGSCIVDKMENNNFDYIKGLMLGSNIY